MIGLTRCHLDSSSSVGITPVFLSGFGAASRPATLPDRQRPLRRSLVDLDLHTVGADDPCVREL